MTLDGLAPVEERWLTWVDQTSGIVAADPSFAVARRELFDRFLAGQAEGPVHATAGRVAARVRALRRPPTDMASTDVVLVLDVRRSSEVLTVAEIAAELTLRSIDHQVVTSFDHPGAVRLSFPVRAGPTRRGARWYRELAATPVAVARRDRPEFLQTVETAEAKLVAARRALRTAAPSIVVSVRDQPALPAAMSLAAREAAIPALALQHGTTAARDLPVIADRLAVWGPRTVEQLTGVGADPSRLAICGSARHDALLRDAADLTPDDARRRLDLPGDGPVLIYFSSGHASRLVGAAPITTSMAWIGEIARLLEGTWTVAVKPHPSEEPGAWADSGLRLLPDSPPTPAIVAATAVGGLYSTVLEEAALLRRPAMQLLGDGWPDLAPTWRGGGATRVRTPVEAADWLRGLDTPEATRAVVESQVPFATAAFANQGTAVPTIVDLIEQLAH